MNVKLQVSENIVTPQVAKSEDDFLKLFMAEVMFQCENIDPSPDGYTGRIKSLLHDYLALVLTGKIKPYEVTMEGITNYARKTIQMMTQLCAKSGVPTKETDKGELEIDLDTIIKNGFKF